MPRTTTEPINAQKWQQMYEELEEYRRKWGHCKVPQTSGGRLGKWVKLQRKKFKADKMPLDRIQKLDALGFIWNATNPNVPTNSAMLGSNVNGDSRMDINVGTTTTTMASPSNQKEGLWNDRYRQLELACRDILEGLRSERNQGDTNTNEQGNAESKNDGKGKDAEEQTDAETTMNEKTGEELSFSSPVQRSWYVWTTLRDNTTYSQQYKWIQEQRRKLLSHKLSKRSVSLLNALPISTIWSIDPAWCKQYQWLRGYGLQFGSVESLCGTNKKKKQRSVAKKALPLQEWVQQQQRIFSETFLSISPSSSGGKRAIKGTSIAALTLEQAELLQDIPGWSWHLDDDNDDDEDDNDQMENDFGRYYVQLKRMQIDQQQQLQEQSSGSSSFQLKINLRKAGPLGKYVQKLRHAYLKLSHRDVPQDLASTSAPSSMNNNDVSKPTIDSLAAAAETLLEGNGVEEGLQGDTDRGKQSQKKRHRCDDTNTKPDGEEDSSMKSSSAVPRKKKARTSEDAQDVEIRREKDEEQSKIGSGTSTSSSSWLTARKIQALDAIGFSWNPSNVKHTWDDMFNMLKEYRAQHGDCLVPKRYKVNPKLGMWVGKQRDRYKRRMSDGSILPLTDEQIEKLNSIGMVWTAGGPEVLQSDWQNMYEKLKLYKQQTGSCNVSQKAPGELGRLGRWVKTQREKYHGSKANLTPLTDSQRSQLEAIGFEWRPGGSQSNDVTWYEMFRQLQAFREEHGHVNVPQKNGKLGGWVDRQRKRYRATLQAREYLSNPEHSGTKPPSLVHNTTLSEEQIDALNSIGFVWSFRVRAPRSSSKLTQDHKDSSTKATSGHPVDHQHVSVHVNPYQHHYLQQGTYYNQHPYQQPLQSPGLQQLPHLQGGVMMNAPEDEAAATRSLLYFQGGRGLNSNSSGVEGTIGGGHGYPAMSVAATAGQSSTVNATTNNNTLPSVYEYSLYPTTMAMGATEQHQQQPRTFDDPMDLLNPLQRGGFPNPLNPHDNGNNNGSNPPSGYDGTFQQV